jgi:hypothetical protein
VILGFLRDAGCPRENKNVFADCKSSLRQPLFQYRAQFPSEPSPFQPGANPLWVRVFTANGVSPANSA